MPFALALVLTAIAPGRTEDKASDVSAPLPTGDSFFATDVWPKVGAQSCLKCHKEGGDAEDSKFVLQDPARDATPGRHVSLIHNQAAFARMAAIDVASEGGQSRLLLKATGKLHHEGEVAL